MIQVLVGHTDVSPVRIVMDRTTLLWVKELDTSNMEAVEISGERWKRMVPWKRYETADYPEYDICKGWAGTYDMVIAEQVWEHLAYPWRAAQNVHGMLRDGGCFLITVPFLYRIHRCPLDCTRWTAQGLGYFLEEAGFPREQIRTGQWGNRQMVRVTGLNGHSYCRRLHRLDNEEDFPLVSWALARK